MITACPSVLAQSAVTMQSSQVAVPCMRQSSQSMLSVMPPASTEGVTATERVVGTQVGLPAAGSPRA